MRFGLLGTGWWADNVHARALATCPEVEFAGVWGRDAARASAVAERHGTRAGLDLDALLGSVDAVAIAVPPDVQVEEVAAAAEHGGRHDRDVHFGAAVVRTLAAAERFLARPAGARGERVRGVATR